MYMLYQKDLYIKESKIYTSTKKAYISSKQLYEFCQKQMKIGEWAWEWGAKNVVTKIPEGPIKVKSGGKLVLERKLLLIFFMVEKWFELSQRVLVENCERHWCKRASLVPRITRKCFDEWEP